MTTLSNNQKKWGADFPRPHLTLLQGFLQNEIIGTSRTFLTNVGRAVPVYCAGGLHPSRPGKWRPFRIASSTRLEGAHESRPAGRAPRHDFERALASTAVPVTRRQIE